MSSLPRRMQRALKRNLKTTFGRQIGITNPKAKDLLARQARDARK